MENGLGVRYNLGAIDEHGNTFLHKLVRSKWWLGRPMCHDMWGMNTKNKDGATPLHLAATQNCAYIITDLIKAGADPNARDNSGRTALHIAAAHNNIHVVHALLNLGAKVDGTYYSDR